jgi:uncharacterized protein YjiS (DUF1127 family)
MNCIDTIGLARLFRRDAIGSRGAAAGTDAPARSAAPAMLMASRDIEPLLIRVADRLADWQDRRAGRRLLMTLDDRALRDISLDRATADEEYRKPFWR